MKIRVNSPDLNHLLWLYQITTDPLKIALSRVNLTKANIDQLSWCIANLKEHVSVLAIPVCKLFL